jgi:hypothetical protein
VITIKKTEALSAVKKVMPGVENGSTIIEGADAIVFTGESIHSYNDTISVSVPFDSGEVKGVFKGMDLFRLLQKLPEEDIQFEPAKSGMAMKSGNAEVTINSVESDLQEYLEGLGISKLKWKSVPEDFWEGIRLCKISCSTSSTRGIFITNKLMMSTDGIRLNYYDLNESFDTCWVDDPAWTELLRLPGEITEYSVTESWIHFRNEEGVVFSAKRKEDEYYPTKKMLALRETVKVEENDIQCALPKDLDKVIDRVAVFSEDVNNFSAISITVSSKEMVLESHRVSGKIRERVPFSKQLKIESPFSFKADADFLIEAVHKVPDFYYKEGETPAVLFQSEQFTQIMATVNE